MKSIILGLSILVTLVACIPTENDIETQQIVVKAQGRVLVAPDMATLTINIQCLDRDIERSAACLIEKAEWVTQVAKAAGILEYHIQSNAVYQNKEYQWQRNSQVFMGYRSSMQTVLTIKDVSLLNKLYPQLLKDDKVNVQHLQYSRSDQDSLTLIAQERAFNNAERMADNLMRSMAGKKKKLISMGNVESAVRTPQGYHNRNEIREESMADAAVTNRLQIQSGQIQFTEWVYVSYQVQ